MSKAICRVSIVLTFLWVFFSHSTGAQIVPGVQQSAAQTGTITGAVTQSDGTPVAGADVRLIGPAMLVTKSDAHGTFAFASVPYGVYTIVSTATNFGAASRKDIAVKGDVTVAIQYAMQSSTGGLKTIARVSTSSSGAQINVTPASIASISPSEYAFQGNTSWKRLLDQVPGVTVGGSLGGGASFSDSIADSPFQPIVLSINGAMPYETSTTLDGMPLDNSSYTNSPGGGSNLSYLPLPAFDTADVVRGPGANAPSIVDSIGGSFVLHAPGRVDKNQFNFSISNDPYGGVVLNAKAALRFGKLSAVIVYGINDSPGPLGKTSVMPAFTLTPATVGGQTFNGCTPSGGSCGSEPFDPAYANGYSTILGYNDSLLYCCVPFSTQWSQHNGAVGLSYDLTRSISAQLFYTGSSSEMQLPTFGGFVNFTPGTGYSGSIAPGPHTTYTYVEGPIPITQASSLVEEKITAYVGRGVLRLSALQSNSFSQESETDELPNGTYTLYGTGYYASAPATPVNFNGMPEYLTFPPFALSEKYWNNNRDFLVSYATQIGSAWTIGASYVTSYYNYPYEFDLPTYGLFSSQSQAVSETTREMRLNAGVQVSDKLSLDASWYFTRGAYHVPDPNNPSAYADSQFPYNAPRLGAVWRANPNVVIRMAAGGGFALPEICQLVGQNFLLPGSTYYEELKTNLNLRPETSFGFDVGTDIRFHQNTVLSLDLYRTELYGQFFQTTNLTGIFLGLPLYTEQYNNLAHSRYEGINLDLRHDVPHGIYWNGALGLTRAYVVDAPSSLYNLIGCSYCTNTYIVPEINFNGEGGESPVPYTTATAQFGYRWSPEKYIDISPTYYGNGNAYFRPAFVEFDAHMGYPLTKNVSLITTLRNITGIYGQNYEYYTPTLVAPAISGPPYALFGTLYGPRALIVTGNFRL